MADELKESSVLAFTEALHGPPGELDAWLEVNNETEVKAHVLAYARACIIDPQPAVPVAELEALPTYTVRGYLSTRGAWHKATDLAALIAKYPA